MILKAGVYELGKGGWAKIDNARLTYKGYIMGIVGQPPFKRHELTDSTIIMKTYHDQTNEPTTP